MFEFEHLLTKAKLEEGDKLVDFLNRDSKHQTQFLADAGIKNLPIGTYVQFQRVGNFRIDNRVVDADGNSDTHVILIPSGKSKGMSIKTKVKAKDIAKGGKI